MSRYTIFAVIAALALLTPGVLSATAGTTLSLTAASFNADPSVVFDNTNVAVGTAGADAATWGSAFDTAWFGPASTNETVITYALDDIASLTKMIVRVSNGSLIANDTADTTLYAKKTDATPTLTAATIVGTPKAAIGLGSMAIAYAAAVGGTYASHQNLYLLIVNAAGSVVAQKAIVSTASVTCADAATDGKAYTYTVGNVFYENSTYYVSYTTVTNTWNKGTTTCTLATATADSSFETKASVQGFAVDSSLTAKWTTVADFATSTTFTSGTFLPQCGPQNYTNSTTFYCTVWSALSSAAATRSIMAYPITVATGAVGTAVTVATNSDPTTGTIRYTVAGFVYGMYQQGILLNCATTVTTGSTITNTLNLYNFTSGATSTTGATPGGIVLTGFSTTTTYGAFSGAGVQNGTGFILLTQYVSADASTTANSQAPQISTHQYTTYNGSAVKQGDTVTIGTVATGQANWFVDAYGALWFGGYSIGYTTATTAVAGTPSEIYKGQVGRVIAQLYDSAGNVLASFFAIISLMIAALFAF